MSLARPAAGGESCFAGFFFIAAGLVFCRVKWYNKNVCGAKTASGVTGDCQNRKQEDLFP
ncbi:MAG: hypothetical protein EGP94_15505 [Lachnospiraceae bacterium]|nr:hypothetical protein [Lachnospiraceae bacterium]